MIVAPGRTRRRAGALLLAGAAVLSVTLVAVDGARFPRTPDLTVGPPVTLQALLEEGSQARHTVYAFLRTEAPGARIVIDSAGPDPDVGATSLRALGAVGRIDRLPIGDGPLGPAWMPDGEPDLRERLRTSAWEAHREPGPIDTVLVGSRDGRTVLVDRRSVPELDLPVWDGGSAAPSAPTFVRAVVVETALLVGLLLLGGLVLPRHLTSGVMRPALALLAGAAVQASSAHLFLAGRATMVAGLALAAVVAWRLRRDGIATGWTGADLLPLGASVLVLAGTAAVARIEGLVLVTADAIAHVERAIAIGAGTMGLADLAEKRPLALAVIHAPAHALGVEGLHALGWALLLAAAVVLAALPLCLLTSGDRTGHTVAWSAGGVVLVLVLTVPMLRTMAAFLNTHLLVAVLLLLLCVLWALDRDGTGRGGVRPLATFALLALIPARTESVLIVGLVLLATLAVRAAAPAWPWAWPVVGGGLLVWNGLHVVAALDAGTDPSFPVTALTSLGAVTLLAAPVVLRLPPALRRGLAVATMGTLWLVLLALLMSWVGSGVGAVAGLRANLGEGDGAWGVFAPLLAVLVVAALVVGTSRPDGRVVLARWFTLGAVPSVLLAKAADGTDRVSTEDLTEALDTLLVLSTRVGSWGDSANRMWSHFVLAALALLVMTAVLAFRDGGSTARPISSRTVVARRVAAGVVGLVIVAGVLAAWRPAYLGPASPGGSIVLLDVPSADEPVVPVELTEGSRVEADLVVRPLGLPDDVQDVAICATFRLSDVGRIVTGRTRVGLSGPSGTVVRKPGEFARAGEWAEELCLAVPASQEPPTSVLAWAEGDSRGTVGGAAVLLTRPSGVPVERLEVRYVAASDDPRGVLQRLASTALRIAIRGGPLAVALLTAVGLGLVLAPDGVRLRDRDGAHG